MVTGKIMKTKFGKIKNKTSLILAIIGTLLIGAGVYGVLATFSPPPGAPPNNDNNLWSLKEIAEKINPNATCLGEGADNYPSLYGLYTALPVGGCNKGPVSDPCKNMDGDNINDFDGPSASYGNTNYSLKSLYNRIGGDPTTSEPTIPSGGIDANDFKNTNTIASRIVGLVAAHGYSNCAQYCGDGTINGPETCDGQANCNPGSSTSPCVCANDYSWSGPVMGCVSTPAPIEVRDSSFDYINGDIAVDRTNSRFGVILNLYNDNSSYLYGYDINGTLISKGFPDYQGNPQTWSALDVIDWGGGGNGPWNIEPKLVFDGTYYHSSFLNCVGVVGGYDCGIHTAKNGNELDPFGRNGGGYINVSGSDDPNRGIDAIATSGGYRLFANQLNTSIKTFKSASCYYNSCPSVWTSATMSNGIGYPSVAYSGVSANRIFVAFPYKSGSYYYPYAIVLNSTNPDAYTEAKARFEVGHDALDYGGELFSTGVGTRAGYEGKNPLVVTYDSMNDYFLIAYTTGTNLMVKRYSTSGGSAGSTSLANVKAIDDVTYDSINQKYVFAYVGTDNKLYIKTLATNPVSWGAAQQVTTNFTDTNGNAYQKVVAIGGKYIVLAGKQATYKPMLYFFAAGTF